MKTVERIHLLSSSDALQPLRQLLQSLVATYEFNNKSVDNIILAINEACMNIIQHAYSHVNDGEIVIEIFKENKSLVIKVIDYAKPSDLSKIKSRDLGEVRPGGLGVHFIYKLMDKVVYKHLQGEMGNLLEMHKNFDCVKQ